MPESVVLYLPCHVHGGARELGDDIARLADTLDTLDGRRLIFTSSAVLYDGLAVMGDEASHLLPARTYYALTKRAQEEMIRLAGVDAVILRLGSLVGVAPTMRWDLLPQRMVWEAVTTGWIRLTMPDAHRPFLMMRDAVRAIEWATTAPAGTYNIATVNALVEWYAVQVAGYCGATIDRSVVVRNPPTFGADTQRVRLCGWQPNDHFEMRQVIAELAERARRDAAIAV